MNESDMPPWLTTTEITDPVRHCLNRQNADIADWTCTHLTGGAGECLGVWRLAGNVLIDNTLLPWSLILKGWAAPEPSIIASAWNWPHREMEMYRSGLLADLSEDIRAPACYDEIERPDGSVWLWLEDLTDDADDPWPLDRYARVARRPGQFNGAYLADRPLPQGPRVSQGWLCGWVEAAAPYVAELAHVPDHPLLRQVYPSHVIEAYTRLWADRHTQYAALGQLPQVFCHLDAFRRNLFIRQGEDGTDETVLIDWAFAGTAGIGEELAPLVAGSVSFMEVLVDDARHLEAIVLEGYIEGLRDVGWRGNADLVRTGYGIAVALRYGVGALHQVLPTMLDERRHPFIEQLFGKPMSEITWHSAAVNEWFADLAPKA